MEAAHSMTFVVTGSNGFIGCNTCSRLAALGAEVIGIDDLSSGLVENAIDGVQYHYRSVTDTEWLSQLLRQTRPQAVIHLAALPKVSYSVQEPLRSATSNAMGTLAVLQALARADLVERTRLVIASSSSVYGRAKARPTPETHPCQPVSPYALAKLQSEQWCNLFHVLFGQDVVCLRYFNVYGPFSRFGGAYSGVIPAWLHYFYVDSSYQPYLAGNSNQTRDFTFVDDVVQANLAAATRAQGFAGETLNIGSGRAHSLLELREAIESIVGRTIPLERRPPRIGDVDHTLADISRARAELAYEPGTDIRSGLTRTIAWFREARPAPAAEK